MSRIKSLLKRLERHRESLRSLLPWVVVAVGLITITSTLSPSYIKPKTDAELAHVSVEITTMEENSGGSGVVLRSYDDGSIILTNNHICEVMSKGGVVHHEGHKFLITGYRKSTQHDVCEIRIRQNLHINVALAPHAPEIYSEAVVVGHPELLPTLITRGHFSEKMEIQIQTGMKPCDPNEKDPFKGILCVLLGGLPEVTTYETQVISATIMAGSSGSPVFNADGELSGVVFAGMKGLSYGMIVPYEYVASFVEDEAPRMAWEKPSFVKIISL